MSHAMRIGTLGLMPYHVFSMEELEEATDSFDSSNLIEDGPRGQVSILNLLQKKSVNFVSNNNKLKLGTILIVYQPACSDFAFRMYR